MPLFLFCLLTLFHYFVIFIDAFILPLRFLSFNISFIISFSPIDAIFLSFHFRVADIATFSMPLSAIILRFFL